MKPGFGFADYLLYLDRKAAGAIEAKAEGTLTGVEAQSAKYAAGLPANLPAVKRPLPFLFESNGSVTYFTNGLDPKPRSRQVFSFPRSETLIEWLEQPQQLRARLKELLRRTASERVSGEEMADPVPVSLEVDCAPFFASSAESVGGNELELGFGVEKHGICRETSPSDCDVRIRRPLLWAIPQQIR